MIVLTKESRKKNYFIYYCPQCGRKHIRKNLKSFTCKCGYKVKKDEIDLFKELKDGGINFSFIQI